MHIITIATKRSLQETDRHRRKQSYYTRKEYQAGDVIEVIDGNKKNLAVILKIESAVKYKQAIRDGSFEISALKLSKTGDRAGGVVIAHYPIADIKRYFNNADALSTTTDKILRELFPRRKSKQTKTKQTRATKDGSLQSLSIDRYANQSALHHTPLQLFVDDARNYFGETSRHGIGSFSYYLGMCKKIPMHTLYQIFGEAKQAPNKSRLQKKKLFWWKIGQYLRQDKEK
ncbi:MAG: hypothetical protein ACKKL4_00915 [Patescibacteria group bacterium]